MPRVRGLREYTEQQIEAGAMHEVTLPDSAHTVLAEGLSHGEMVEALQLGHTIVSAEFQKPVRLAHHHEVYPDKQIEERRSAHGVSFGRLVGHRPSKPGRPGTVLSVAMKPFDGCEAAVREVMGYQILREIGVETFQPVGIFHAKQTVNGSYRPIIVMTEKRNDFISQDREEWIVGRQVSSEGEVEIAERNTRTVKEIVQTLAWLHINGVFHPDGQVKNYAVTSFGKVGIIDTENMTTRPLLHSDTITLARQDLEKLLKSLIVEEQEAGKIFGVGMLARMPAAELRACCQELVVLPYTDALTWLSELEGVNPDQAAVLFNALIDYAATDVEWPSNLVA